MKIIVKTDESAIPFSRNILANSLNIAGLDFLKAYEIAEGIRKQLENKGRELIPSGKIMEMVEEELKKRGDNSAERYHFWRNFKKGKDPLVILLGGGTGVGTTRIGLELSRRLLVSHISTDVIRSVLRSILPDYLVPALHTSSFLAGENLEKLYNLPPNKGVLMGFRRHIDALLTGVKRVLKPEGVFCASTNSDQHLTELKRLLLEFDWKLVYPAYWVKRFSLESGLKQLRQYFGQVEVHYYNTVLKVDTAEPIIGYALSIFTKGELKPRIDRFRDFVQKKIDRAGGIIEITPCSGLFKAKP